MVDVLKRKKVKNTVEFECRGCEATLRANKSEGKRVGDQRDGDAYVFKCPDCGRDTWIDAQLVDR